MSGQEGDSRPAPTAPSDDEVISAVKTLRETNPDLSRAKILSQLRTANNWILSEARMKKLTPSAQAQTSQGSSHQGHLSIPEDALAVQLQYHDESTRIFKIYGRGEFDYGVSPNADQQVFFALSLERVRKIKRPRTEAEKRTLAGSPFLKAIWDFYVAAAAEAGVSNADVGTQIEAEFGVPWTWLPTPATEETGAQAAHRKAEYRRHAMQMKREMLKHPEAAGAIPVNERGEPIWDEKVNGQFVLVVVKIKKGDGLQEFGQDYKSKNASQKSFCKQREI